MIDLSTEVIAGGLGVNLLMAAFSYGKMHTAVGGLRESVSKLEAAIHNGLTSSMTEIKEDVASLSATCEATRARGCVDGG